MRGKKADIEAPRVIIYVLFTTLLLIAGLIFAYRFIGDIDLTMNIQDYKLIFEELDKLRCEWQEPKVSQWFYIGSENGYHWFIHRDLPEDKFYRVSISEYEIENPIIIMNDQSKWVLMPWGPGSDICDKKLST